MFAFVASVLEKADADLSEEIDLLKAKLNQAFAARRELEQAQALLLQASRTLQQNDPGV